MLQKLEQYLFYLLLFSIPFQTRKILWYDGWRFNEWQSVSMYATDLLLVTLFLFWVVSNYSAISYYVLRIMYYGKSFKPLILNTRYLIQKSDFYLIAFLVISAVSVKNSSSLVVSWFQWLKLLEFVLFYFYLSRYAFAKFGLFSSFLTIIMAGLFQAFIAITQLVRQSSIGLRYLGESVINIDFSGVASFYLSDGEKFIRAYGTTPHPNVLASFLLLAIFAFYFVYLYSRLHSEHSPSADTWDVKSRWDHVPLRDKTMLVFYGVILFAFFATFSRVVIFIWFMSFCFRSAIVRSFRHYRLVFGTKDGRKRITALLLVSLCVIVLFSSLYLDEIISRVSIDKNDQSFELRVFYNKEALGVGAGVNLFGVGIGNFVGWLIERHPYLPHYAYQPAHNIYLLIYSETGIFGLSALMLFLAFLVGDFIKRTGLKKAYHLSGLVLLGSMLFIGFFDHLFWTLQQGRLIFWSGLGILTYLSDSDII